MLDTKTTKLDLRELAQLLGSCVYPADLLELLETPEDQLPLRATRMDGLEKMAAWLLAHGTPENRSQIWEGLKAPGFGAARIPRASRIKSMRGKA